MNQNNDNILDYVERKEPVSVLEDNKLLEVAEYAEKRIAAVNRIKEIVLKVTNNNDWTDQQGKPYLSAAGCHKVANIFGIGWRFISEPKKVIEEDGHYRYDVPLEVFLGNRSIEIVGSRSTKDEFFTTRYRDGKKVILPPTEIDGGDILKAAITNAQGIGISTILGIRNLTWDEVKNAGIDQSKTSKVDYKKPEMSEGIKDLRAELERMLLEMAGNSKVEMAKLLMKFTSFIAKDGKEVQGKSNISDLSEKAIPVTYGKVKEVYEQWKVAKTETKEEGEENAEQPSFM